jgi:hypothetical protein
MNHLSAYRTDAISDGELLDIGVKLINVSVASVCTSDAYLVHLEVNFVFLKSEFLLRKQNYIIGVGPFGGGPFGGGPFPPNWWLSFILTAVQKRVGFSLHAWQCPSSRCCMPAGLHLTQIRKKI